MAMQSQLKAIQRKGKRVSFAPTLATVRCFDINECPSSVSGNTAMTLWATLPLEHTRRLTSAKIILESIALEDGEIIGQVRVHNLAFQKQVTIRYTIDNWVTFLDQDLEFIRPVYDSPIDQDLFQFKLKLPLDLCTSSLFNSESVVLFALRYRVNGLELWDNNMKRDYSLVVTPHIRVNPTEYEWKVTESGVVAPLKRTGLCRLYSGVNGCPFLEDPKLFTPKPFDNLQFGFAVPRQPTRRPALPPSTVRLKPKKTTFPTYTFVPANKVVNQPMPVPAAVPFFDLTFPPMPLYLTPEPPLRRSFFDSIPVDGSLPNFS